jgi:Mn2+/Fe2+ NRAMP family transporter
MMDWASIIPDLLAYAGPGYLILVGYMDPGNWARDIAGDWRRGDWR